MSIFKNNKEEENRVAASEPHVEQESEVLSAEDVKALAPLYDNVVLALKQVYDPEIPVNIYDLGLIYELVINTNHEAFEDKLRSNPQIRRRFSRIDQFSKKECAGGT